MDQNKLTKLKEIGYRVKETCGTCKHFLQRDDADFGDCQVNDYAHLKHTGGRKKLSVVKYGHCDSYVTGEVGFLHGFTELLK
jgi:hypothetical protein